MVELVGKSGEIVANLLAHGDADLLALAIYGIHQVVDKGHHKENPKRCRVSHCSSSATAAHACVECIAVLASDGILLEGVCIGGSSLNVRTLQDLHTTLNNFVTHFQVLNAP